MEAVGTVLGIKDAITLIVVGIFTIGLMEITRLVKQYVRTHNKMR
jgi:hypothetical protein